MAASIQELSKNLELALGKGNLDDAAAAREAIVTAFPDTEAASEASYKLGLDALFRKRDLDAAGERMRAAAKGKGQWATLARSALGMVLLRQGKHQQAVFELRKVASVTPPTVLSAHGWGLVVYALRESKNMKEAERARGEHKKVLIKLTQSKSPEDAAIGNFMLGMEYKFDGDRTLAKQHFTTALAGPLPGPERLQCEAALKEV